MKNKTLATWLTFFGGPLGLHRFYLKGFSDGVGWMLPIPTALGLYGIERVLAYGQDDKLSWVLIPLLGLSMAMACLAGIVYALMDREKWNREFNPDHPADAASGGTSWITIGALIAALMVGTVSFMGSLAFGIQHYFQYQIEEARKISQ